MDTQGTYESRVAHTKALLEDYLPKKEHVCLSFSGGKESVVLAHMLKPWRHKTWLVWVKTPLMAPHMEDFVRGYQVDYKLVEVPTVDPRDVWKVYGHPGPVAVREVSEPHRPTMLLSACCYAVISQALFGYYGADAEPLRVNGIRAKDGERHPFLRGEVILADVNTRKPSEDPDAAFTGIELQPLWAWTQDDVFRYVQEYSLKLPVQYSEGCIDSLECLTCPGKLYPQRLAFLKKHYPKQAEEAVEMALGSLKTAYGALEPLKAALENEVRVRPF